MPIISHLFFNDLEIREKIEMESHLITMSIVSFVYVPLNQHSAGEQAISHSSIVQEQ